MRSLYATADELRERGRAYGIPECCIDEFIADVEGDRAPAELRGSLSNAMGCYVPCWSCSESQPR